MATKRFNLRNPLPPKGKAAKVCCETPYMTRTILGFNDTTDPSPPQPSGQFEVDGERFSTLRVQSANGVDYTIDWGEGGPIDTFTGSGTLDVRPYTYSNGGIYIITISGASLEVIDFGVTGGAAADSLLAVNNFPDGITAFLANGQELISLPALPSTLTALAVTDNRLAALPTLPVLVTTLFADTNELSSAEVDTILITLDTNGQTGGTVNLSGQNPPAPPGVLGIAAAVSLILKAWTVATD